MSELTQCTMLVGRTQVENELLVIIFEAREDAEIQATNWKALERFTDIQLLPVTLVRAGHFAEEKTDEEAGQ